MKITDDEIRTLLGFVAKTSDEEISCQTCEDRLAQFAEAQLTGKQIPVALAAIQEHLRICSECTEELGYILQALEDDLDSKQDC